MDFHKINLLGTILNLGLMSVALVATILVINLDSAFEQLILKVHVP